MEKISQEKIELLKKEIDDLIDRLSQKKEEENEYLKSKVKYLEMENLKLKRLLYGENVKDMIN